MTAIQRLRRPIAGAFTAFISVWLFAWLCNAAYIWGLPSIEQWDALMRGLIMMTALTSAISTFIITQEVK